MLSPEDKNITEMLLSRLERISADAYWAHRASGVRGALLKAMEMIEAGCQVDESRLHQLTQSGFHILGEAAREKAK
jgi:hypothetical protein